MLPTSHSVSPTEHGKANGGRAGWAPAASREDPSPALVVCFVLPPAQAETLISVLQEILSNAERLAPGNSPTLAIAQADNSTDAWLNHADAAKYLGISKSTLYHHAEQEHLESRKFCGRLEYRVSSLERFKNQQLRPSRRSSREDAIIGSAPSSGK